MSWGDEAIKTIFIPMNIAYHWRIGQAEGGYDYRVNVNHPDILTLYTEYRRFLLAGPFPISDNERKIFEADVILNLYQADFLNFYYKRDLDMVKDFACDHLAEYDAWVDYRKIAFPKLKEAG